MSSPARENSRLDAVESPAPSVSQGSPGYSSAHGEDAGHALQTLQAELAHSHRLAMLGTVAAGVAHELNNLLTPVLAYAQLARANPADEALQAKALSKTITGVERATSIARSLLNFSTDHPNPNPLPQASVRQAIDDALDALARDLSKDGIKLTVRVDPALHVAADPVCLQQVLLNLIINARRAMSGQADSAITIDADATDPDRVAIHVRDTGPGFDPRYADVLFQPFVSSSADPDNPDRTEGYGLGLAVCRILIERAGGQLTATATPGQGAHFTITLPLARTQRAAAG